MNALLVQAASVAGQEPSDSFLAVMYALLFVGVGCGVIAYMAIRHAWKR
ncbi:hypothetical protein [Kutzneria sp. NPDC051319]